jgi:DNA primase
MNRDIIDQLRSIHIEKNLADRGHKLKKRGAEWVGACPSGRCDSDDDGFNVKPATQQFYCRKCASGGHGAIDLIKFLDGSRDGEAIEKLRAVYQPQASRKDADCKNEERVASFTYHDAAGALRLVVERYEWGPHDQRGKREKTFKQMRPDPQQPGVFIRNAQGVPPLIYRLPDVLAAIERGQAILGAEGEAKADLLHDWNIAATCCPGGAKKWKPEHSAFLKGADVVLLPDNDKPGRQHVDLVAASLKDIAQSVYVLELPGLDPKGDIIDWARQGGTAADLDSLIKTTAKP